MYVCVLVCVYVWCVRVYVCRCVVCVVCVCGVYVCVVCAELARIVWMLQRCRIINVRVRRTASVCFGNCDFIASAMNGCRGLAE